MCPYQGVVATHGVRLHWRVTAAWPTADGRPGSRTVEAAPVVLAPSSGTALWRALAGLLPSDDELISGGK